MRTTDIEKNPNESNILDLVEEAHAKAVRASTRALIIQPGALGDSILTLPLAQTLQEILPIGNVDMLGHMDTLSLFPGRTCIQSVRSLESVELHRFFTPPPNFTVKDQDPLIYAFADYDWIISFMGSPDSDFEKNLIYTVHCNHSAEIITLPLKPEPDYTEHVTTFYQDTFSKQCPSLDNFPSLSRQQTILKASTDDQTRGRSLLQQAGVDINRPIIVIHPGSGGRQKCWHLSNFIAVAEILQSQGAAVAFLTGPVEEDCWTDEQFTQLRTCAPLLQNQSLEDSLTILSTATGVITNDNGISHLSAGLGIKTVVLFGPTAPHQYRPIGPAVETVVDTTESFTQTPSPPHQQKTVQALDKLLNQA